jgi:hypothetical protein
VGWKKYSFVLSFSKASAVGEQNSVLSSVFTENDYMRAFLSNLSLRPSCYNCPAKAGKSGADITIGDFWGIENVQPELDDDRGMSVLVNYNEIKCRSIISELYLHAVSYPEILVSNPCLEKSVNKPVNRDFFFSQLMRKGFNCAVNKTFSTKFIDRLIRYASRIML